ACDVADWSIEAGNYAKLHRVTAHGEHNRNRVGGRLGGKRWCDTNHDDHANLAADEIDCERRKVPLLVLRPAIFNRHVLPLNIADFREPPPNGIHAVGISFGRSWGKESDHRHRRLLRARRERPRRRAAQQRYELAPLHSITSSAMARMPGGTVRPIALAVLRLRTNSNFVDWTTGRSAGRAPPRILPA